MPNEAFYKTKDWHRIRTKALFAAHFKCAFCEKNVRGKGKSRVDHIIPRKEAPELELELSNLRVLCPSCDNRRHADKGSTKTATGLDGMPTDPEHPWYGV